MIVGRCIEIVPFSSFFRGHVSFRRCIPFGPDDVWRIPSLKSLPPYDIQGHLTELHTEAFQLATIDASSTGTLKVRGAQISGVISSLYQHHLRGANMTLFGVVNDVSGHPLPFIKNPFTVWTHKRFGGPGWKWFRSNDRLLRWIKISPFYIPVAYRIYGKWYDIFSHKDGPWADGYTWSQTTQNKGLIINGFQSGYNHVISSRNKCKLWSPTYKWFLGPLCG